jgi:hypothetical protein
MIILARRGRCMQGGQTKRGSSCREGKREKSKEIDIKKIKANAWNGMTQ